MMRLQADTGPDNNLIAGNGSAKYSVLVDRLIECINSHLSTLMKQMLSSADDKLGREADQAGSVAERSRLIECVGLLRESRENISQYFFNSLNNSLANSGADESVAQNSNALVDQDEMDEMVAITTMYSKAMNVYGKEVEHLEARLEYLEIMCEEIFDKEAIDPKNICEIFKSTIATLNTDIDGKLVFYKLFDQEVCARLGVMYRELNRIFIDNNILPEIVLTTTKNSEIEHAEEQMTSRTANYYNPEENIHTDFIPRTKEEISRIVNEFMSGEMTISGDEIELPESFLRTPTQQDLDGKNCYQRKEVLMALSKLQRKLTSLQNRSATLTTTQIKQELLEDIGKKHQGNDPDKRVNLLDERSMDFVGLMFDAIARDDSISDIMTNLINRLQIPVMKLAMTDRKIFDEEQHPARVTIDLLTTAGKGINSRQDPLYQELEVVVNNILTKFDNDIATFESAIIEINGLIDRQKSLAEAQEKKQRNQVVLEHARHIVTTQLRLLFYDKKIPQQIKPLVFRNWASLMLNRYIRHGRGSTPWLQSVLLLKLLVKCIQPIRARLQYHLVSNNHVALVEAVRDELLETKQDKNQITEQINALNEHLCQLIAQHDLTTASETRDAAMQAELITSAYDDNEEEVIQLQRQEDIAKKKIAQLSSNTRPGVWYEIYTEKDKAVRRLKLSVILDDVAQLIFVDHKGMKVIEKDAEEFARELRENRSRVIADHSTFDHALGRVIGRMAA